MYAPVILTCKVDNTISISSVIKGDLLDIVIKPDKSTSYEIHEENLKEYVKDFGFNVLMGELCKAFQDVHNFEWYNDRCNSKGESKPIPRQRIIEGVVYEEVIPEVQRTLVKWADFNEVACAAGLARYKNAKMQLNLSDLIESIECGELSNDQIIEEIRKVKAEGKLKE